jgi:hypothetical protein
LEETIRGGRNRSKEAYLVTDCGDDHNDDDVDDDDKNKGMCCTWKEKENCFQF